MGLKKLLFEVYGLAYLLTYTGVFTTLFILYPGYWMYITEPNSIILHLEIFVGIFGVISGIYQLLTKVYS